MNFFRCIRPESHRRVFILETKIDILFTVIPFLNGSKIYIENRKPVTNTIY